MQLDFSQQAHYLWALLPEIVLSLWLMAVLLVDVFQQGNRGQPSSPSIAWLALLYHGLDGLRVIVTDFAPSLRSRQRLARGVVAFVLFAAWIPTALVIVWPAVRGWFAA